MNHTVALTHLAVPGVLHRWRVLDAWTTARYRSIQILREGAGGGVIEERKAKKAFAVQADIHFKC